MTADAQTTPDIRGDLREPSRWTLADAEQCAAAPFERHAGQHPDRLAVFSRGTRVTYGELNARANRLAHALIARGVHGDRVALALDHDASMITGLLAAWKAGMVAVPLEITNPLARLAAIVADASCALIVGGHAHEPVARELARHGAIVVNADDLPRDQPAEDPRIAVKPGDVACLVYTSGSTGKPKGVMQTHRLMVRNVAGYSVAMAISPRDRFVLLATCAAAQGLGTVMCALANGASLFPFNAREAGVEKLAPFIREHAITLYISAATVFRHLTATLGEGGILDSIRLARLGSEPIHGSDAAAFARHFRKDCVLLTALSSTETANVTLYHVDPARDVDARSMPVGWPVDGMEVLLLDEAGRDVGLEREGEIVVRSRYLSPGYWRDAERTAAVFVEAADGSDLRCYHTGDLGSRRADGCLVHTGRRDFRVKIRGFGIELEEVETVLRQHPRVQAAVVSVRVDKHGDNQLVAHLAAAPGAPLVLEELQQHILARLAAHMLPAEFFVVAALPLTPNGKVDRRAVAALTGDPLRKSAASLPPRNALERKLLSIWEDVLRYRPIGVDDNFFAIGGNSLLAGLVIARVTAVFHVELPVRAFLDSATIAELARLIRTKRLAGIVAGGAPAIVRVARGAPIAASFAQQRLWLLDRLEPGSNAYNVPRAIRLGGRLDVAALERALREIVRRHETLRTTFSTANDEPVQVIAERAGFTLATIDCSDASENAWRARLETESLRPFDLQCGPLFRATLFRLRDDEHVLLLNLHHIISDLWSNAVLTRELTEHYNAFLAGQPAQFPELPIQYADYAVWQRQWLQGDVLKRQCDYWSAKLAGLPALDLPTDRPRPAGPATAGAAEVIELPSALTDALGHLARENQSTLYMTLLAIFHALMHRYTGQEDFAVGGVIAGRNHVDVEKLIGFFINTLVHRADLSGDPTFLQLLARVRETALGALEHQDLPFERLVEILNPPRVANRTPFFQVAFLLQNTPRASLAMSGLEATVVDSGRGAAKFDLTFNLHEEAGRLRGAVEYNPALFERATVQRMVGHFRTLCESVVREPSCKIAELPLLTSGERTELLVDFNRPSAAPASRTLPLDGDATLAALFEAQAARTPDALALTFEDESLSYAALDARAEALATRLRALGVGPEVIVGLYLERSLDLVVAIIAVLKSGGAYLPIDLAYPAERVAFMLEDAQAPVLLTQEKWRAQLPATNATVVCVEGSEVAPPSPGAKRVPNPDGLAYVIYTSGTTGKPKGTQITHRNVVRLFSQTEHWFGFDAGDVWTLFHSCAFDFSVWELWGALLYGGRLVVVPHHVSRAPDVFYALLAQERVTVLNQTPSAFRQLILAESLGEARTLALRHVIFGGEALEMQSLQPWFERHGDQSPRLVNMYGITETTVHVTYRPLTAHDLAAGSVIGMPIPDLRVHILDARGQPVPIGVPGEMYVAGAGLARGYLRRPDLTAERFIPNHLGDIAGARLYRTGDLARYLAGGEIEFLGRIDHQVKVRGFRVELGEIESVLMAHPRVREAAVIARNDQAEDQRLVAYVVAREPGATPTARELREHLLQKLPDYMVPAAFVALERLPLTTNGKLDRRALPAPDETRIEDEETFVEPSSPMEKIVAEVWRDLLRLERVGRGDNFFELGGHSLLAMQVSARIGARANRLLPLRWLFDHPTVEAFAAKLSEVTEARGPQSIPRAPRDAPLPLSHEEARLWFLHHAGANPATYNVPWAARLRGPLDIERVRAAFSAVMQRHEILRTAYVAREGVPMRVIAGECVVPFTAEEVLERDVAQRIRDEAGKPFVLEVAPLLRVTCLRVAPGEHVLLVVIHHIICDEWSLRVLRDEIETIYASAAPLPAPALPYADYAAWQRGRDASDAFDAARKFWRESLDDAPSPLALPTDHVRPAVSRGRGFRHSFSLDPALVEKIEATGGTTAATPYMIWLALFAAHLARSTGQNDMVIGTPLANRRRPELQRSIGFFLNTLPLRLRLDSAAGFSESVRGVRAATLAAFEHGELPLDEIIAAHPVARSSPDATLFSVMFVLHNESLAPWSFPPAATEMVRGSAGAAKCDLMLSIERLDDGGCSAVLEADADLFREETVARMAAEFSELLERVAGSPETCVAALPLLDEWNATTVTQPETPGAHILFEQQADATPELAAVHCDGVSLTYAELDRRANHLAHELRAIGVGPDACVGICLERSLEMIVALLGVLKAGGAYLPLDPAYPAERLAMMFNNGGSCVLITQPSLASRFSEVDARVVMLEGRVWPVAGSFPGRDARPALLTRPDHLAYVIHTSGSTGEPKGVAMPHRALANLIHWQRRQSPLGAGARTLQYSSLSFDVSFQEMFATLSTGGALVLVSEETRRDPHALWALMDAEKMERIFLPFVALQQLAEAAAARETLPPLREVITAGEQLQVTPAIVAMFARMPPCRLHNHYGPSESHVVTAHALPADPSTWPTLPPIGRPIDNARITIVDPRGELVPVGAAGELLIAGDCLARGYINSAGQTAAKFVTGAIRAKPGERVYRTGDLARWTRDGSIEFLGRIDAQVKIRGHRIEPGEIEAFLRRFSGVRDAAVVVREDQPGDKRLVAYVVANEPAPTSRELREFLLQKLPEYMVPAAFVALAKLPLTTNGKLDRRALPAPDESGLAHASTFAEPGSPLEQIVAGVWRDLLRLERVGRDDNFFELGGHSLLAMQATARVSALVNSAVPLRWLFDHPTVRTLAARLGESGNAAAGPAIPRAPRDVPLPLSHEEARLWFLQHAGADTATYNVPWAGRLSGALDVERLRSAFMAVMERHEILRTAYVACDGIPVRVIAAGCVLPFSVEDVAERDVASRVQSEARKPFALEAAPLFRVVCLRIRADEHVLIVVLHHIICDEWSLQVFRDEVESCHAGATALPAPGLPYADFAAWQRARDAGDALNAAREFWRHHLEGAPAPLELPLDHVRPAVARGRGLSHRFVLERALVEKIESIDRTTGATPFMIWLALFSAHLARSTGENDMVIGTPLANRGRPELQRSIGFFLNTLPLRVRVNAAQSFKEHVRRVRQETLAAFEHGELPLDEIVASRATARTAPGATLFSVMFVLLDEARTSWNFPPAKTEVFRAGANTAKCDLTFFAERTHDGGLACLFEADADLFLEETIIRMAEQFRQLLVGIADAPDAAVQAVSALPAAQRDQLVAFSRRETVSYPRDTPVHVLFAEQAKRIQAATALVCGAEQISYGDLDERANRLARHLQRRGVRTGAFVGVLLDRSVEFVVSVLAVLKAGAGYVPLNPHDPATRLRFILDDTATTLVIASGPLPPECGALKIPVVDLAAEGAAIKASPNGAPETSAVRVGGADPACVIYTSGSTGRPKGVVVPHRAIARLVRGQIYARFEADERFMFLASPGFDASTFELWGPLLNGAACVIFPERWPDLERLENEVRTRGVTCLWLTAGLFNQIIDQRPGVLATVAHVLTGGEALSVPHVRRALEVLPSLRITNGYGPTECTTFACTHTIARGEEFPSGGVPIGRPIANTHACILDEQRRRVPIGTPGELYLGGDGLAIGYLRQPELTAGKFVADPFSENPAARLYRTGDRCRWRADGTIEFLGRLDDQVKVRGFRVELGEIEAALCGHPAIARAAVTTRAGANGVRELAAFVVARDGAALEAASLRAHLGARLPEYMVPASFAVVENLPLNASGKVDRAALLAQAGRELGASDAFVAPRDATETALAKIWQRVLARERIGVTENFFALGGHSLLAMRLVHEIGRHLGRSVPIMALFAAPTIESLARGLADNASTIIAPVATKLRGHGPGTPVFHIPGLGGYEFLPVAVAGRLAGERPFFDGLQFRGLDGREKPLDRVEAIATDLVRQIRDVRPRGPYCFTGYCFGGLVAFEIARQLVAAGETVEGVVLWDTFPARRWRRRSAREVAGFVARRLRSGGPEGRAVFFLARLRFAFSDAGRRVRSMAGGQGTPLEFELPGWAQSVPAGPPRDVAAAAYRASRTYRAQPYDGRIVVVRTLRERLLYERLPLDGWQGVARGPLEFHDLSCDHFEMLREPAVHRLADLTATSLCGLVRAAGSVAPGNP